MVLYEIGGFRVRQAVLTDVPALAELERRIYGALGTVLYDDAHIRGWHETFPEGLVVAERVADGETVGYAFSQFIDFAFERIGAYRDYDQITDHGTVRGTHDPAGNAIHTVNLCSLDRGAGLALMCAVITQGHVAGKSWIVTLTRMSGFDRYMRALESSGRWPVDGATQDDAARWYAHETARMIKGHVWPSMTSRPELSLPALSEPDPVVRKQLGFVGAGLAAVIPNCMQDPQSRDYQTMLIGDLPLMVRHLPR